MYTKKKMPYCVGCTLFYLISRFEPSTESTVLLSLTQTELHIGPVDEGLVLDGYPLVFCPLCWHLAGFSKTHKSRATNGNFCFFALERLPFYNHLRALCCSQCPLPQCSISYSVVNVRHKLPTGVEKGTGLKKCIVVVTDRLVGKLMLR